MALNPAFAVSHHREEALPVPPVESGEVALDDVLRLGFVDRRYVPEIFSEFVRGLKVSTRKWYVLGLLLRRDGMTQSQLAEILDVRRSSLSTMLGVLQDMGFIVRHVDPQDRRIRRIHLRSECRTLIRRLLSVQARLEKAAPDVMDTEELRREMEWLEKSSERIRVFMGRIIER